MTRCFYLLLILALAPCGFASGGEAVDREAVAETVLAMVASFSCHGIITEDSLERLKRQANPRNATAAIEIIPDLLRNEKEMDLCRQNAYMGFIRYHATLFGIVKPEINLAATREIQDIDDPEGRRHIQIYYLISRAIRNAPQEEKDALIPKVMELFPFEGRINTLVLSSISHEYGLSRAIEVIDQLIERHADKSSFVKRIMESREHYQRRLDGTAPEPYPLDP